jgi:hypothetical protein
VTLTGPSGGRVRHGGRAGAPATDPPTRGESPWT